MKRLEIHVPAYYFDIYSLSWQIKILFYMITGILKESGSENRVAMLPGEAALLKKLGPEILVENDAGINAYFSDDEYIRYGVTPVLRKEVLSRSDLLLSVNPLPEEDLDLCHKGQVLCSVVNVAEKREWLEKARNKGLTVLALDIIPRTTRAQAMDILSSMATVSGYKAVLEAASLYQVSQCSCRLPVQ